MAEEDLRGNCEYTRACSIGVWWAWPALSLKCIQHMYVHKFHTLHDALAASCILHVQKDFPPAFLIAPLDVQQFNG